MQAASTKDFSVRKLVTELKAATQLPAMSPWPLYLSSATHNLPRKRLTKMKHSRGSFVKLIPDEKLLRLESMRSYSFSDPRVRTISLRRSKARRRAASASSFAS